MPFSRRSLAFHGNIREMEFVTNPGKHSNEKYSRCLKIQVGIYKMVNEDFSLPTFWMKHITAVLVLFTY